MLDAPHRTDTGETLLDRLIREPERFEFTTALRVAEAEAEAVDIVSDPSTLLAPTAIASVERVNETVRIRSTLSGLVGAFGALPPAYSEIALKEERRRSRSLLAFLNLFADPLLRFFVGAHEKYRLPRLLRWRGLAGGNRIVGSVLALAGLRTARLRELNAAGDDAVLRYAGLFAQTSRNASALGAMLQEHLGLPVAIEQFRGRWIEVPDAERTAIGAPRGSRLGVDAMAGQAIRDHAGAFRVVIGPTGYLDYLSLEPGSPRLGDLMALARLYVGSGLSFDVQVVLKKEDVPECRLGDAVSPPKLGWNCWARVAPLTADSRDAIVQAGL